MNSFRSKPVGWRYESQRHSLAARGYFTKYYHGTTKQRADEILKTGLKPSMKRTSEYTKPGYVYIFGDVHSAQSYPQSYLFREDDYSVPLAVIEADVDDARVEEDEEMGLRVKGEIAPEKLRLKLVSHTVPDPSEKYPLRSKRVWVEQ